MESTDLFIMLAGVLVVSSLIYLNVQKIDLNKEAKQERNDKFERFCGFVSTELLALKNGDESFDEKIDDFVRELRHIVNMNANANEKQWSQKIAEFLLKVDEYLRGSNKELIATALQNKLKTEFAKF